MAVLRISGPGDLRISDYRHVSEPELVRRRGLFVAEGRLVVQRLIEDRRAVIRSLLLSEAAFRAMDAALARVPADTPVYVCLPSDFPPIAGFNIHRGCLALAERLPDVPLNTLTATARLLVVLENVANADNVGGVFRNAAAFGIGGVVLSPTCCDPLYRKAIRTSMAATLRVPFARAADWPSTLQVLAESGFTLVALTPRPPSETLDAFAQRDRPARLALLVGAEGSGLSAAADAVAHVRVRIPIYPAVDSLNLSVATGIALARLSDGGPL